MNNVPIHQLMVLSVEALITALLVLLLFRLRTRFGLTPLYVTLGVFQPIQVLLASSIYAEILPGVTVSPGSVVMFTASLFAILLVYIREDAIEARKVIYGIMYANLTMTLLLFTFGLQLSLPDTLNFLNLSQDIFNQNARVMLAGTLALFADVILIIFVYEAIWRWITRNLFLSIYLTMALTLALDSLVFATGAFYGQPNYVTILTSGIIGKVGMAALFALTMTIYLHYDDPAHRDAPPFEDIFYMLSYRQKFELEKQRGEQTKQIVQEQQRMISAMADTVPAIIYVFDMESQSNHYSNSGIERILGYHPQELQEMGSQFFPRLIHPEDLSHVLAFQMKILAAADEDILEIEYRMKHHNGGWRHLHSYESPFLRNEDGSVRQKIGIAIDVTSQKLTQEALQHSEQRLSLIYDTVTDIIFLLSVEAGERYRFVSVNKTFLRATGLQSDQVLGRYVEEVIPAASHDLVFGNYRKAIRDRQPVTWEEVSEYPNGIKIAIVTVNAVYDAAGICTNLVGAVHDISELKQAEAALRESEERFETIFKVAPGSITLATLPDVRFVEVNDNFSRITGYSRTEALGKTPVELGLWDSLDMRGHFLSLLQAGETVRDFEANLHHRSGEIRNGLVSGSTIMLQGRQYFIGTFYDITDRKRAEEKVQRQLQHLKSLRAIDIAISSSFDMNVTLRVVLQQVVSQLRVDAAAILLFNRQLQMIEYVANRGFRSNVLYNARMKVNEGYAARVVSQRHTVHLRDLSQTGVQLAEAMKSAKEDFVAYYGTPLLVKGEIKGVLEVYHRAPLDPDPEWHDFLETLAGQAAITIDNAQLLSGLQLSNTELALAYDATIVGWSRAMDLRDKETEGHTKRVTELAMSLARKMGIPEVDMVHIRRGGLLHDIGKIGVPDHILLKPGPLTEQEWDIMRQHPVFSHEMLSPIAYLKPALDIPYCHHEKWDGTGYPRGLTGEQIPLAARIFAVVDVWDAVTSDRPYRSAWSKESAMQYIREQSGEYFDPQVVEVFLQLVS